MIFYSLFILFLIHFLFFIIYSLFLDDPQTKVRHRFIDSLLIPRVKKKRNVFILFLFILLFLFVLSFFFFYQYFVIMIRTYMLKFFYLNSIAYLPFTLFERIRKIFENVFFQRDNRKLSRLKSFVLYFYLPFQCFFFFCFIIILWYFRRIVIEMFDRSELFVKSIMKAPIERSELFYYIEISTREK